MMKVRLWGIIILLSLSVSVSATNTTEDPKIFEISTEEYLVLMKEDEVCSLDKDDKPPRPRIILLGETGFGKSTFGNRLFRGYTEEVEDYDYDNVNVENHLDSIVQGGSYLDKSDVKEFGVGYGIFSHTNETVWKVGRWLGDPTNDCVTIIDTPGLQDTNNKTCLYTREIQEAVKQLEDIDIFVILIKGDTTRLTPVLREHSTYFSRCSENISGRRQSSRSPSGRMTRDQRELEENRREGTRILLGNTGIIFSEMK